MVELIDKFKANFEEGKRGIVEKDICLDPCAGTGGFLLAFMKHQIREYNNKEEAKENLIGIERHPGMFVLSVANMLIQGDGKANLEQGNCLVKQEISKKPSIGLMNPPYSDPKQPEIKFAEQLLKFVKNGWAAMIVPTSTFTNKSELNKDIKEKIYKQNTLKAVIQMPSQLFYPLSVPTQIVIFQTESSHQQGDKDDEENEKAKYSLVVTDVSVKDDWSFHYQQKKQIEKDFTELFIVNPR
ncbi:6976_t:CDS:2 [Paraglomus occultum]|uniref:site-specific DNA-methyltransferase (adenine-specific) n=1 Tax=Paraglomus occultum TaxID=144539 RepID=A0A9N8W6C4_9GLOM|nr:6976_t:CDS:2 [Paraglomus occultum]